MPMHIEKAGPVEAVHGLSRDYPRRAALGISVSHPQKISIEGFRIDDRRANLSSSRQDPVLPTGRPVNRKMHAS